MRGKSSKRIFVRIQHGFRLIEGNVLHTQIRENRMQGFAEMSEGHGAMMRILLFNEHVTVEAPHLRNSENTDAAKGTGDGWQNLALCDIRTQDTLNFTLLLSLSF